VSESIRKSVWSVALLLFGVVPLFFAFLFGAYCMFHEHEKFDTLTKTTVTLNAILAGDEILDFIRALLGNYGTIGLIYSMCFCVMFIVCIHNVFVFVVGEAFKDQNVVFEKNQRKLAKSRSILKDSRGSPFKLMHAPGDAAQMFGRLEESVAATANMEKKVIVASEEKIQLAKKKVFNKIIPQSRDKHIIEMNHKKSMVKDDIHYLKESVQNLATEKLGSGELLRRRGAVAADDVLSAVRGVPAEAAQQNVEGAPRGCGGRAAH
jgi:hypothetical protein